MRYPDALLSLRSTLPLSVLLMLTACAGGPPPVVYRDRTVEIPTPVVEKLPESLTADCQPDYELPAGGALPVSALLSRLSSVEDALATCRYRLAQIRQSQAIGPAAPAH